MNNKDVKILGEAYRNIVSEDRLGNDLMRSGALGARGGHEIKTPYRDVDQKNDLKKPTWEKKDMTISEDEGDVYITHPFLNTLRPDSVVKTEVVVDEGIRQVTVIIDGKVFYIINSD